MYSGITIGRVLHGELLYTKILEVNLFAFAYRLFHSCPVDWREISIALFPRCAMAANLVHCGIEIGPKQNNGC